MSSFHSFVAYCSTLTTNVLLKTSNFKCYKLTGLFMPRYDGHFHSIYPNTLFISWGKFIYTTSRFHTRHQNKSRTGTVRKKQHSGTLEYHCCHENQKVLNMISVCVFFLSYPACKSHIFCAVIYCHLCTVQRYHIFPHDLIKGTIFRKNIIVCFIVFKNSIFNISHSKKNSERYYHKYT